MENLKALVLAAGKGTRLAAEGCDLPKVMRLVLGKPLIGYVLEELSFIDKKNIVIVAGYKRERVMAEFSDYSFAIQEEQLGTGHAVMCARSYLENYGGNILICYGDMPLLSRKTYMELYETHIAEGNDCTILTGTAEVELPYGRIIRNEQDEFVRVVEDRDCTPEQKEIHEMNIGVYAFKAQPLLASLAKLNTNNAQKEYYLTDTPAIIRADGGKIGLCKRMLNEELIGVNTAVQLEQVEKYLISKQK